MCAPDTCCRRFFRPRLNVVDSIDGCMDCESSLLADGVTTMARRA
jgi:hypothetical protein